MIFKSSLLGTRGNKLIMNLYYFSGLYNKHINSSSLLWLLDKSRHLNNGFHGELSMKTLYVALRCRLPLMPVSSFSCELPFIEYQQNAYIGRK